MKINTSKFSICLAICYFGKTFPEYFEYFLKTASWNSTIDFYIFTDIKFDKTISKNVKFIHLNITDFNILASKKLSIPTNLERPYKLTDYKPAYGRIFEDFFLGYDFWGHIDIDILFGNIRHFLTDEFLSDCDFYSSRKEYPVGWFSLFRNNEVTNLLFKSSKDWEKIFLTNKHYGFDECSNQFFSLTNEKKSILELDNEIESMLEVIEKKKKFINAKMMPWGNELDDYDLFEVTQNGISCLNSGKKFIAIHFIGINRNSEYIYPKLKEEDSKFYIDVFGILPCHEKFSLSISKRNDIIFSSVVILNYQKLSFKKDFGVNWLTFSGETIDLSATNWVSSIILHYIEKNKGNLQIFCHDIFNFINNSGILKLHSSSDDKVDFSENYVLSTLAYLTGNCMIAINPVFNKVN